MTTPNKCMRPGLYEPEANNITGRGYNSNNLDVDKVPEAGGRVKNHSLDHKRCTKDSLCFQWQRAESRVLRFLMEKHFELRILLFFYNKSGNNNFVVSAKNVNVMLLGFFLHFSCISI